MNAEYDECKLFIPNVACTGNIKVLCFQETLLSDESTTSNHGITGYSMVPCNNKCSRQ